VGIILMGLQKCFWTGCDEERKNRRMKIVVLLIGLLWTMTLSVEAQQLKNVARLGFLDSSTAPGMAVLINTLREELTKLGWAEGKNIAIEYRFAEGKPERLDYLALELVASEV
jgi:putative tryptophan/tyrosine transport system substrate-binding protein